MKEVQGSILSSVGTVRNYEQALTRVAEYVKEERMGHLREITPFQAVAYLEQRGEQVGQSTLNMERQALQCMMKHVTNKLEPKQTLTVVKSELAEITKARAYTPEQINAITDRMTEKNVLPTQICHAAGLRAHEIHTLRPIGEVKPSDRPAHENKFSARNGESYTVTGKGGLIREVLIPTELATRLESHRMEKTERVTDRNVYYDRAYNINGGQKLSDSFSAASRRALGFSHGIHGLRHTYAQDRMGELMRESHLPYSDSKLIVSQELGHQRPEITEVYLR
ncbi:site-specific integrase [Psychromonas antarctica]|uniref:site-specific integrase n=1 Tax=Psychromonas antarctica TaxID=67573 RepID=UPI001EE8494F|nr:site-specific integrase [Psychromonas antarctica]MCG6202023.1 site-specific integrase [Psychromonas antarctica]